MLLAIANGGVPFF